MNTAHAYIDQTVPVNQVLTLVGLAKSSFYYIPKQGKRGHPASKQTVTNDGRYVSNEEVVSQIESLLLQEFVDYGYHKVTHYLRHQGFVINPKKVYRLMKEHHLLHGKRIRTHGNRSFVRFRKVKTTYPYQVLEMDIKYF